jgi:LppX_LprAFG lipoprotein
VHRDVRGALLPLLAVAVLAACGSQEAAVQPSATSHSKSLLAAAAAKTRATGSGRFAMTVTVEGGATLGTVSGTGVFEGRRARMALDLSGLEQGAVGGKLHLVFDDLDFYVSFPPEIAEALPAGRQWLKLDLAALGKEQGFDLEQLAQAARGDPSQSLDYLGAASDDFEEVGTETVRGVETTHYTGTIDLEKLAAQAPAAMRSSYRQAIEVSGVKTVPVNVWLDHDGMARRVRYDMPLPGQEGSVTSTIELYDFGIEVDVQPPSPDSTVDLGHLIGGTG